MHGSEHRCALLDQKHNIEVGAVIEDIPDNTHLKFRMILFWNSLDNLLGQGMASDSYFQNNFFTYLRAKRDLNTREMDEKVEQFVNDHILEEANTHGISAVFRFHFRPMRDLQLTGAVLLLTGIVGLLSGSYPAFYLSKLRPIEVLQQQVKLSDSSLFIRKVLVGLQFTISVFMIIATIVVIQQLSHMRTKELGYEKDHRLIVNVSDVQPERRSSLRNELLQLAVVDGASLSSNIPGPGSVQQNWGFEVESDEGFSERIVPVYHVDPHYAGVYGLEIIDGRFFDPDKPTDMTDAFVINQAAAKLFGWDDPIGKRVRHFGGGGEQMRRIIGVVSDFHLSSLEYEITPLLIIPSESGTYINLKLSPDATGAVLPVVEEVWERFAGILPMRYQFLEERHRMEYLSHENLGRLFALFAALCIFLSLMGLFGLSAFSAEQKTREIGIRVVHGATLKNILTLLYKDYAWLMVLAVIIASAVSVYFLDGWLAQFAYRISLGFLPFAAAAVLAFAVSLATVGYHAWRTIRENPVESLKYE